MREEGREQKGVREERREETEGLAAWARKGSAPKREGGREQKKDRREKRAEGK